LNEHYHSSHGALQESRHVFIEMGYRKVLEFDRFKILEIGFGTGFNALLTALECFPQRSSGMSNTGRWSAYPLTNLKSFHLLNYPDLVGLEDAQNAFGI
jgi:hypothetical protein